MKNFLYQPAPPPCRLHADISQAELVHHLNENIRRVRSWKSSDVTIHTPGPGGTPLRLNADIAVESPRNFRLVAKVFMNYEADFGSNSERFWFWMKRSEPKHVFVARHEEIDRVRRQYRIPFRPDWLMEALGVVPIEDGNITMEPRDPQSGVIRLVSEQISPEGRSMRRTIEVDACRGYILSYSLHDPAGQPIARATLNDYREHPLADATTVMLPHRIDLNWPQAGLKMALTIGQLEVNPPPLPERTWEVPAYDKYPPFDLGRQVVPAAGAGRARVRAPNRQPQHPSSRFPERRAAPAPSASRPPFIEEAAPVWAN